MVKDKERRANKRYKMKENRKYPYKKRRKDPNRIFDWANIDKGDEPIDVKKEN